MKAFERLEHDWPCLLSFLPGEEELEASARSLGAMQRRRAVDSASTLLRLALVWGYCGYSLRQTAAWAEAAEVASLSDVALLKRFRKTPDWLGHLLARKLADRVSEFPSSQSHLRLIDTTTVSAPGSAGTDWRVHLEFDLGAMSISGVELTSAQAGESLSRHEFAPGDWVIADRGYARRPGLVHVVESGGQFIVRLNSASVPLQQRGGEPFDLLAALRGLPDAAPEAFDVEIPADPRRNLPALAVRLVALRKSEEAAEQARKKALTKASKRGTKIQPRTLELCGYVLVITSDTDKSAEQILEIYRFRWQIELVFKRLKSLLEIDQLPVKDPDLARTYLLSKLLAALLLEELTLSYVSFSPWGYRLRATRLPVAHSPSPPA
jgi:hypothetical protein